MDTFKINGHEVRTLRGFNDAFRNYDIKITSETKLECITIGKSLLGVSDELPDKEFIAILSLFERKKIIANRLVKYLKDVGPQYFKSSQYDIYLDYVKINSASTNSDSFFQAKYGERWGFFRETSKGKIGKIYRPEYVMEKMNMTHEEALVEINKFKIKKSTSEKGFIERWGEEEGRIKLKQFKESSKHTEAKYILKYGEEHGQKLWLDYTAKKRETSPRSIIYWLNKGLSEEIAEQQRKLYHQQNYSTSSVQYWVSKGLSENVAINKVAEIFKKKCVNFGSASKESLNILNPIMSFLKDKNLSYRVGVEGNSEIFIYDREIKKVSFYDFFIPELRIAIEYHGERYHPNRDKLTAEDWPKWVSYTKQKGGVPCGADEKYKLDQRKKQLALSKNLSYYEIWSSENKENATNRIINIIKEKLNENQTN